ncbi:hypothetical protein C5F59_038300 [Streptomyces sp. QL37]|uniref:hypothetical protein n=1 Tax=Streptomyces sp. QL37 TaxID=2093747 RepID=UPI000CF1FA1E|nr:hypothetical protein [Streptomyces sp. QL37]PPQ61957.1 hypothetical protein C5F59_38845 [Streptomyces sp. QL37]
MELVVLLVLVVLAPSVKKLVKSLAARHRAEGEATLIRAQGWADSTRALAKAEIVRAKAAEVRRTRSIVVHPLSQCEGTGKQRGKKSRG